MQDFLYPEQPKERHTFRRTDISVLGLTINGSYCRMQVVDLTLDLFAFGAALVTLEVLVENPGTLAEAQTIIDHARRAFPGFWMGDEPGLVPSKAMLTVKGEDSLMLPAARDQQRGDWRKTGIPQIFPWWLAMAAPLCLAGHNNPNGLPEWRHVLDERIPVMSFVSLTHPTLSDVAAYRQISDGDWFRLAGADAAGTDPMPYNATFLNAQADRLFYDRFHWDGQASSTTRQCYAGYHFAMVGTGWFFDNIAQGHFRSHYRQMVFIAQMEFAALLTFSRRISDLVRDAHDEGQGDEKAFRKAVHDLRHAHLNFTHRYVFTDVSNHLQAREMNRMLRGSIGLEALRADVQAELTAASDFASAAEAREATEAQTQLTEFASLFLPATLAVGFGGMNLLAGVSGGSNEVTWAAVAQLALWVALAYLVATGFLYVTGGSSKVKRWSMVVGLVAAVLAVGLWLWQGVWGVPFWPPMPRFGCP